MARTRSSGPAAVLCAALALWAASPAAADGRDDVRVRGRCTGSTSAQLRVRADDGRLRVELRLDVKAGQRWRVVLLHERRIVARATLRGGRHLELRRSVADWFGSDTIAARATGPRGETCRAAVTI